MRIQSILPNNCTKNELNKSPKKSPAFEANIYSVIRPTCKEGNICELAMMELTKIFMKNAMESGKILAENIVSGVSTLSGNGKAEFILLDKSTPLFKKLKKDLIKTINNKDQEKFVEIIKNDPDTVKLPLWATESEICPSKLVGNILDEIFGGGLNPN